MSEARRPAGMVSENVFWRLIVVGSGEVPGIVK
jgi:hypothetical protein